MHRACTACAPCHAGGHHHAEEAPLEYQRRLQSLAADQLAVVCKAMGMPDMRTVVYSTCSVPAACLPSRRRPPPRPRPAAPPPLPRRPAAPLPPRYALHPSYTAKRAARALCMQVHREENEDVVQAALDAKSPDGWRLARVLPDWPARGLAGHACGPLCARAGHEEFTNGFFVARFERSFGAEQRLGSPTVVAAKVGAKVGAKLGTKVGAKEVGAKVDAKVGAKGAAKGAAAPRPAAPRSQEPPPGRELSEKGKVPLKRKRAASTPLVEGSRPEAEQQRASWTTPEEQAAERKAQKRRRKDESRKMRKQKRKP